MRRKGVSLCIIFILNVILCYFSADSLEKGLPFSRIVSLAPAITEVLFAIGAGDKVVGVTVFDNYPEEVKSIPKVGDFSNPSLERILYLKPDLVLGISNMHRGLLDRIEALGITCYSFNLYDRLDELYSMIELLGDLTLKRREALLLVNKIRSDLDEIRKKGMSLKKHPRVFFALWDAPLATIGRRSYINELIEIAGGISITSDVISHFPIYSVEKLILDSPDLILVAGGSGGMGLTKERLSKVLKGKGIVAVERGDIYEVDADLIFRLSSRIVEGAKALYEVFKKWSERS